MWNDTTTGHDALVAAIAALITVPAPAVPAVAAQLAGADAAVNDLGASVLTDVADLATITDASSGVTKTSTAITAVAGDATFAAKTVEQKAEILKNVVAGAVSKVAETLAASGTTSEKRDALRSITDAALTASAGSAVAKIELNPAVFASLIAVDPIATPPEVQSALNGAAKVEIVAPMATVDDAVAVDGALYCPLTGDGDKCFVTMSNGAVIKMLKIGTGAGATTALSVESGAATLSTTAGLASGATATITVGGAANFFIAGSGTVLPGAAASGAAGDPFVRTLIM